MSLQNPRVRLLHFRMGELPSFRTVGRSYNPVFFYFRQKALTPIIAGTISGTCVVLAWIVALVAALWKRHKRKKKYKKVGRLDLVDEHPKPEVFIVPPDPAVVQGQFKPGERVIVGKEKKKERQKEGTGKGKAKANGAIESDGGELRKDDEDVSGNANTLEEGSGPNLKSHWKGRPPRRPEAFTRMSTIWSTNASRQASAENVNRRDSKGRIQRSHSNNIGSSSDNITNLANTTASELNNVKGQASAADDYAYREAGTSSPKHLYPPS